MNKHTVRKFKNNNMDGRHQEGGGLFGKFFGIKSSDYTPRNKSSYDSETGYHLTAAQKKMQEMEKMGKVSYSTAVESENKLIESYENLAKCSRNYYKSYNKHLGNLITLDESLGIHGLTEIFKSQVIKNIFKGNDVVDKTNPLLLRNYLVSNKTMPRNFRKEHLLTQVRYILRKFNPKDELLIQSIDVTLDGNKASIKLYGLNGEQYERTASVDKDFNLDLSDLKRNLKEVLLAIKRKMDFEIEIVSDFDLGGDDIEIPGLMFIDDDSALDKRLKDLQLAKSLRPDGPIPLSQMSIKDSTKKPATIKKKNIVFGVSEPKQKYQPVILPTTQTNVPPGEQGFGEARQLDKKPFNIEDAIANILGGPPAADVQPVAQGVTQQPGQQLFQGAIQPQVQQPYGMQQQQPAQQIDTRDELEKKCNALTSQPDVCKSTLGCWYNTKLNPPKCHRGMKIV